MKHSKRILVFIPFLSTGGAEKQGILLAHFLAASGHKVTVWGFDGRRSDEVERALHISRIETATLPHWPDYPWFTTLRTSLAARLRAFAAEVRYLTDYGRVLPRGQFDVAIPFTPWPSLVCILFRRRLGNPLLIWNHRGGDESGGLELNQGLVIRIEQFADFFVANSSAGARFLARTFPNSPGKIVTIPNFYSGHLTSSAAITVSRSQLGYPIVLTHIANAYPEKDIPTLITGAKLLMQRGHVIKIRLIGGFPVKDIGRQVVNAIKKERLESIVEILGPLDPHHTMALLLDTDIGLLSSRSEGTPNAVMEFMANGIPVVGTKIPGISELVGSANRQLLFRVGDAHEMCSAVEALINDPTLRTNVALENLKRLTDRHSASHVGKMWLELIGNPRSQY